MIFLTIQQNLLEFDATFLLINFISNIDHITTTVSSTKVQNDAKTLKQIGMNFCPNY